MISLPDIVLPKREFFGLSIDRTSLRALQIGPSGRLVGFSEVPLPNNFFVQNTVSNTDLFAQAVKKVKEQGKFTTPYVVVCFPEAFAFTRELTIPKVPLADIQEAVLWHVKDLFPFPADEIYFDWRISRTLEKEYSLTVVAVQKKTIDPIVEALQNVGLKPLRLKPDESTIASILGLATDKHAIVTEVNRSMAYVTLVEGEKALFTTIVPFTVDDTAASYLVNVKQTIQEITHYYQQKQIIKDEKIDIILTGEVASDHWVSELPAPTKMLMTPIKNPAFNKAYATALPQMLAIREEETINLLPSHMQEFYNTERNILYYRTILFRACSFIGAYLLLVMLVFVFIFMERQQLDNKVKQLITINQSQTANSHNLLSVNGVAKQIIALAPLRKTPHDTFALVTSLVPQSITISQWTWDDSKLLVTLSGVAKTREELLAFKETLTKNSAFTNVSLPLTFLESTKDIPFSLTLVIK